MTNILRMTPAELADLKARMAGADLSRLLYVAITRAAKHCVIVV